MKRLFTIVLGIIICVNLVACSGALVMQSSADQASPVPAKITFTATASEESATTEPTPSATVATPSPAASEDAKIEVDKGLFAVEITIPVDMLGEGADVDKTIAEAKKAGVSEVVKNDDKSLTYRMSKAVHAKLLADLKAGFAKNLDDITASGNYKSIKKITYNDDFSAMEMVVDKKAYEGSMDGFVVLALVVSSGYYQIFSGVKEYKMTLTLKDEATGDVIDTKVYPDAFQTTEE